MPVQALMSMPSTQAGAPVVDNTGLSGNFDVKLQFSPGSAGPPASDAPPPSSAVDDAPSLFTAVQEQLGLKLMPTKVPLDRPSGLRERRTIAPPLARSSCLTAFRRARDNEDESATAMAIRRSEHRCGARSMATTRARSDGRAIASQARFQRA